MATRHPAAEALQRAAEHHRAGRIVEAETACRSALGYPAHEPEVLHALALIVSDQGRTEEALASSERAVAARPTAAHLATLGRLRRKLGRLDTAVDAYRAALALAPNDAELHAILGMTLREAGRHADAVEAMQEAARLRPGRLEIENDLSLALYGAGRTEEALALLRAATAAAPHSAAIRCNLAHILIEARLYPEAEETLHEALGIEPGHADSLVNLGAVLNKRGRHDDALDVLRQAVALRPDDFEIHRSLIRVAMAAERPRDALAPCLALIALRPDSADAYSRLAIVLNDLGRAEEALVAVRKALDLDRDDVGALVASVSTLGGIGRHEEALALCCRLAELRPDSAEVFHAFGVALDAAGRWPEALAMFGRGFELEPDNAVLLHGMARAAEAAGAVDAALELYDRAVTLAPDNVRLRWNRSLALLTLGRFEAGWREYEARWQVSQFRGTGQSYGLPRWAGEALDGRNILLQAEQGLGDTIQFARYVPEVARRGGRVVLSVQPPLLRLMRDLPGVWRLTTKEEPPPAADLHCPLLSLAGALGADEDGLPFPAPYLRADPETLARWQARLAGQPGMRVGLVWAGNPMHRNDHNRSMPLDQLVPLLGLPGLRWFSLQVGPARAALQGLPPGLIEDLAPDLGDFADTAAAMSALDLVLAVDTSCAHLAGALGVPVWAMLPFTPDWRWMRHREDSPWYPTMRLFRQPSFGDWASVARRMADELGRCMAGEGAVPRSQAEGHHGC